MSNFGYKCLTVKDRILIEKMLKNGASVSEIADKIRCHPASVYRELKRGSIDGKYSAEHAQKQTDIKKKNHGTPKIVVTEEGLAQYIAYLIKCEKLSVKQVVSRLKKEKKYDNYPSSAPTLYNAIYSGAIPGVTRETLQRKETHMFSNRLLKIPEWICKELDLKDGEPLNIDIEDNKIVIRKADNNAIEK